MGRGMSALAVLAQVTDSAPSPAPSGGTIPLLPAPGGSLPPWLWQALMALVVLYAIASAVGAASPNSRIGAVCRRWTSDLRNLAARAPAATDEKKNDTTKEG